MIRFIILALGFFSHFLLSASSPKVSVGADMLFTEPFSHLIKGKKIGLITNHTAVNREMNSTIDLLKRHEKTHQYKLAALFAPEHGITGAFYAAENVDDAHHEGIPIFSLHGKTRRPSKQALSKIDTLIFDIQDIGSRSYTYNSTLFYAMEEAAKANVSVIVLDRPNPVNGLVVDGPMLEDKWRSFIGYINVPYCHGMTVGELACFFNEEYKIGCKLQVVPMKGWNRSMTFQDTGLPWVPTSPNIPEASTAFYYPMTGILGELQIVNIGIGYTLPFKLIGAPWIDGKKFSNALNQQKFPGVYFKPFYFRPFYGRFAHENCEGVLIVVSDPLAYKPVSTQYLILGILKSLYPAKFAEALAGSAAHREMFCKANGTDEVYRLLSEEKNIVWKLRGLHQKEREAFSVLRKKYLLPEYN